MLQLTLKIIERILILRGNVNEVCVRFSITMMGCLLMSAQTLKTDHNIRVFYIKTRSSMWQK